MSEVTYELRDSFQYADKGGDMVNAMFVEITAPNYKQIDKATPLKQIFARAIKEIQEGEEVAEAVKEAREAIAETASDDGTQIRPKQAVQLLYASSEDATKALLYAAELFKSGAARVDGEVKMTAPMLDKMSVRDFEELVGTYLVNFIVPSLMDGD